VSIDIDATVRTAAGPRAFDRGFVFAARGRLRLTSARGALSAAAFLAVAGFFAFTASAVRGLRAGAFLIAGFFTAFFATPAVFALAAGFAAPLAAVVAFAFARGAAGRDARFAGAAFAADPVASEAADSRSGSAVAVRGLAARGRLAARGFVAAAPSAERFRVFAVAIDESSCRGAGPARVAAKISCAGRTVPAEGTAHPGYRAAVRPGWPGRR
jgi:hypothetical protein